MPGLKEISDRGSFCQDAQYRGIFLQVAVSDRLYFPEYRLLALLRWNPVGRVAGGVCRQMCQPRRHI